MKHVVFDCDGTLIDVSGTRAQLFPGIKELLVSLAPSCHLYVWTARGRMSTIRILTELGVAKYFDAFCTPDDCLSKPHVQGLIHLVGGIPKSSICVIGDTGNDILGAKNFGVIGLGAIWGNPEAREVLKDYGADFIVNHPEDCSRIIELNLKGDSDA